MPAAEPSASIEATGQLAHNVLLGVPVNELIDQLEDEGVKAFAKSYDDLLAALGPACTRIRNIIKDLGPRD